MCGIAGIVRSDGAPVDRELVARMNEAIRHRGPDDDGFYFSNGVGLAMRRLAIIDLKSGHQPIHNQDSTAWIVFNGEIYNYRELRDQLEKLGHKFYTDSDTEAIIHASARHVCLRDLGRAHKVLVSGPRSSRKETAAVR